MSKFVLAYSGALLRLMQMKLRKRRSNPRLVNILKVVHSVLNFLSFISPLYDVIFLNVQVDQVLIENLNLIYLILDWHREQVLTLSDLGDFVQAFAKRCLNLYFVRFTSVGGDADFLENVKDFFLAEELLSEAVVAGEDREKFQGLEDDSLLL